MFCKSLTGASSGKGVSEGVARSRRNSHTLFILRVLNGFSKESLKTSLPFGLVLPSMPR